MMSLWKTMINQWWNNDSKMVWRNRVKHDCWPAILRCWRREMDENSCITINSDYIKNPEVQPARRSLRVFAETGVASCTSQNVPNPWLSAWNTKPATRWFHPSAQYAAMRLHHRWVLWRPVRALSGAPPKKRLIQLRERRQAEKIIQKKRPKPVSIGKWWRKCQVWRSPDLDIPLYSYPGTWMGLYPRFGLTKSRSIAMMSIDVHWCPYPKSTTMISPHCGSGPGRLATPRLYKVSSAPSWAVSSCNQGLRYAISMDWFGWKSAGNSGCYPNLSVRRSRRCYTNMIQSDPCASIFSDQAHIESNRCTDVALWSHTSGPPSCHHLNLLMWVKQCHKPSPSHHHFYRWYKPFPIMGVLLFS